MTKASDNEFPSLLIKEGSAPSSPSAGDQRLYIDSSDHKLKRKNSSGTVTSIETGAGAAIVATDAIWDAAGDLAVGTGADTAAKLSLGASGKYLKSNGSTVAYDFPPGYEFDYVENTTSSISVTNTVEASADTIVTANAVSYDGSTIVIIEFFSPSVRPQPTIGAGCTLILFDGSSAIGYLGVCTAWAAQSANYPVLLRKRITPSNASHTYSVRAITSSGTSTVFGGAGGSGTRYPMYIRQTKV